MKMCPRCKTAKPKTEFYNNRCSDDGLHSFCKMCSKEYTLDCRAKKEATKAIKLSIIKKNRRTHH